MSTKKSRTQYAMLNISFSLVAQLVTALIGLVLPQLMITTYGSEANGLIASITQFLSFISLLEAGAGGVIRSALYRPLANRDMEGISGIYKATQEFFRKIGFVFIVYVVALCFVYPLISKTEFEIWYVVLMILILSIGTGLQYFLGLTNYSIIVADQKAYIAHASNVITLVINFVISFVLIKLNTEIHIVKIVSCAVFAVKPLFCAFYVKRKYSLNKNIQPDKKAIAQRWNGLVHHLAYFVHVNTDVVLLTVFMGTGYVSIYTVYAAVVTGIRSILMAVSDGIAPGIGNLIVKDSKEHILHVFERFELLQTMLVTIMFSTTASMIVPFMQVYTRNITDYNYILPLFGCLIALAESFYCVRCIYTNFSLTAGRYRETQIGAITEATLNLVISIILIQFIGMVGIAIGTVVGMFTRMVYDICYTSRNILDRPIWKAAKNALIQLGSGCACVILSRLILPSHFDNWIVWVLWAMVVFIGTAVLVVGVDFLFYRENLVLLLKETVNRVKSKISKMS